MLPLGFGQTRICELQVGAQPRIDRLQFGERLVYLCLFFRKLLAQFRCASDCGWRQRAVLRNQFQQ